MKLPGWQRSKASKPQKDHRDRWVEHHLQTDRVQTLSRRADCLALDTAQHRGAAEMFTVRAPCPFTG